MKFYLTFLTNKVSLIQKELYKAYICYKIEGLNLTTQYCTAQSKVTNMKDSWVTSRYRALDSLALLFELD